MKINIIPVNETQNKKEFPFLARFIGSIKGVERTVIFLSEKRGISLYYKNINGVIEPFDGVVESLISCYNKNTWEILPKGTKVEFIQE